MPGLAGRSAIYIYRQLYDIQHGARKGVSVALMQPVVAKLTQDDMIALAAFMAVSVHSLMVTFQPGPLLDSRVNAIIARLEAARRRPPNGGPRSDAANAHDPSAYADYGFSIAKEQGDLIYLLCRAIGATRVAEFATSVGMSTLFFAAAVRDKGGGVVIGSEIVPAKRLASCGAMMPQS